MRRHNLSQVTSLDPERTWADTWHLWTVMMPRRSITGRLLGARYGVGTDGQALDLQEVRRVSSDDPARELIGSACERFSRSCKSDEWSDVMIIGSLKRRDVDRARSAGLLEVSSAPRQALPAELRNQYVGRQSRPTTVSIWKRMHVTPGGDESAPLVPRAARSCVRPNDVTSFSAS